MLESLTNRRASVLGVLILVPMIVGMGSNVGGSAIAEPPTLSTPKLIERSRALSTPGLAEIGGWSISTEIVPAFGDDAPLEETLLRKFRLLATARLIQSCFDSASIPESLGEGPRNFLLRSGAGAALGARRVERIAELPAVSIVGGWSVSVALPRSTLESWRVGIADVIAAARSTVAAGGVLSAPEAMLLVESSEPGDAQASAALIESWRVTFGAGIAASAERSGVLCLPSGYSTWPASLLEADVEDRSVDALLSMLSQRPFDPVTTSLLGSSLRRDGWRRCAEFVESLQTIPIRGHLDAVQESPASESVKPSEPGSERDDGARRIRQLLESPACDLIIRSNGLFPFVDEAEKAGSIVPSITAFERGQLLEALEGFAASIERCPDADALSYASACLLGLRLPEEAAALARCAYRMKPRHPYAGINLLRALRVLGDRNEVARLLPAVSDAAKVDVWGVDQLRQMRAWLRGSTTPASPADSVSTP